MKNKILIEIEKYLSTPVFFDYLKSIDSDAVLNSRDEAEFDNKWMGEFNSLKGECFNNDDIKSIDYLREEAFKISFRVINNAELSSSISDDIEIISKSLILGKSDSWAVTCLWSTYINSEYQY